MSASFVTIDRETGMLIPPNIKEWIPKNSLVHFVVDAVESLDIQNFSINHRGSGCPQFPPSMMLSLLVYCYATGRFSSRAIEQATHFDVAVRYICGGDKHPDHDTICTFRTKNREAFQETFLKVLMLAQEMGHLKKVGGIAIDGSKIQANASKHKAVSYKHAEAIIKDLELEIEELTRKAEQADSAPLEIDLSIPEEIERREERKGKLLEAKKAIEERYKQTYEEKKKEYDEKKEAREKLRAEGKKPRGKEPEAPSETPPDTDQYNHTDNQSRIMKAGNGNHFEQAYNGQAVADTEGSMLILGAYVTDHSNDKKELSVAVDCVDPQVRQVSTVCADAGYYSESEVDTVESKEGAPTVYCAVGKQKHYRTVKDLEQKPKAEPVIETATAKEKMENRLKSVEGRSIYKKRKETIEPIFGIIKARLGFRQFLLRGVEKVAIEWKIVTLAYNVKRLYKMNCSQKVFV